METWVYIYIDFFFLNGDLSFNCYNIYIYIYIYIERERERERERELKKNCN